MQRFKKILYVHEEEADGGNRKIFSASPEQNRSSNRIILPNVWSPKSAN